MEQIYNLSASEMTHAIEIYLGDGVLSRAVQCYERLLYKGKLHESEYLCAFRLYIKLGDRASARRVALRYENAYHKSIKG